jgi:hypothetical protein
MRLATQVFEGCQEHGNVASTKLLHEAFAAAMAAGEPCFMERGGRRRNCGR